MEIVCSLHKHETNENCKSCNFLKDRNSDHNIKYDYKNYNNDYKAYRSQYTQNDNNKPLKYSPSIYLERIIKKHYKYNTDIMNNYDKILDLNDELENAYKQIKDVNRNNSLNVHFKLYKLMQICGVKCDMKDFKISIKLEKALNEYQTIWKKICEINEWKLIE